MGGWDEDRGQSVLIFAQDGDGSGGYTAEGRDWAAQLGGAVFELNGAGGVSRFRRRAAGIAIPPSPSDH